MTRKNDVLNMVNVYKEYVQGQRALQVLTNVSLSFEQNKSYAITGVSGSGKSSLLHVLGGLDQPTAGHVTFNDKQLNRLSPKLKNEFLNRHIGFVFQFHYLLKELTVRENIMIMGMIKGDDKQHCHARVHQLLELVGLTEKADISPTQLSGGQQQRVAIARALFNKPSFLLADEPTGNLDGENAQRIVDVLFQAQHEWGMGIVICSHDPGVYKRMTTVYRLYNGNLVLES